MQDASDFSLPIIVVTPEPRAAADDHQTTVPFRRPTLPGVGPRVARVDPARPRPAARHASPPDPGHPVPSRQRARRLLGVPPPPPTRAAPLSDDDGRRMERRARAWRRIAWAQRMLERFQFAAPQL
jgi:hypothetical protein